MSSGAKVWVTRAQPGAARTAARLLDRGLDPVIAPLIAIRPLTPALPDASGFDGLIFTSRNGVAMFADLGPPPNAFDLPVFTVGGATAEAARQAGFARVRSADGDVHALAHLIRDETPGARLLHPGALQPAGDLGGALAGISQVVSLPVYEAVASDLPPPADFDVVLIHSPRAARELAARLPVDRAARRVAIALSAAAAAPLADLGFAAVGIAETPDETALLDALQATLGKPPIRV
ncbi:MAG: uroporphyrinogen-III synthase [Brevundimonas sp.]|uniref:uroporphyrinogen-III synthase n=1 Tax=Brevundimonas sp. TaxID=1871086 RepID=UPI0040337AA0